MRPTSNRAASLLFVVSSLAFAISACAESGAHSNPMGVIIEAGRRWEQDDPQREKRDAHGEGATIYGGEALQLEDANFAVIQVGRSRILLNPSPQGQAAQATLHHLASGFSVDLNSGAIKVITDQRDTFVVIADGIKIEPLRVGPASAEITRASSTELDLVSLKGALRISMRSQIETVEEGTSYRVDVLPEHSLESESSASQPKAPLHSWFTTAAIAATIIGTGIAIWRAIESPCRP